MLLSGALPFSQHTGNCFCSGLVCLLAVCKPSSMGAGQVHCSCSCVVRASNRPLPISYRVENHRLQDPGMVLVTFAASDDTSKLSYLKFLFTWLNHLQHWNVHHVRVYFCFGGMHFIGMHCIFCMIKVILNGLIKFFKKMLLVVS